jgi:deoxyribodipyrimidine photolyase
MISSGHNSSNLVWLRLDLRLTDNPALAAAVERGGAVIPVFIHAPEEESPWLPGGASCWWLHQSLRELDARLRERGSQLAARNPTRPGSRDFAGARERNRRNGGVLESPL